MVATIISAVVFLLIGALFPHKTKPIQDYEMLVSINKRKYMLYEALSVIPLFFFVGIICYGIYLLGNDIQEIYLRGRETDFAIYPPDTFWLAPGLCFGFGLILRPMEFLYYLLLREEYDVYIEYTNRKHGIDGYKVMRPLCAICVVAGIVVSFLALGWYKEIKGDKIVIDDFTSLTPQEYTIQDIVSITHYEQQLNAEGVARTDPYYKIAFTDGRVWDTSYNFHEVSDEKADAIVKYFTSRSKLQVRCEIMETVQE
ncbi:hypothetical protein [Pontibacter harenae]|uniref:hypothetical protein n=1 Tax=Pontibacter harenae TaxID=2894083 RepID=UPI001E2E0433|nr:hypothetical protein [Pontibacter harenae]MCC9165981.1 hypothetical protein [Pontibacter harenae]